MRMCAVQWSILCFLESPSPPQFCNHNWVQQHILPRKPQQAGGTGSGAQGDQWDAWTYPAFSWWQESHLQRKDTKQVRGVYISTLSASANFLDNCYKERIMNSMHFMAINVWHNIQILTNKFPSQTLLEHTVPVFLNIQHILATILIDSSVDTSFCTSFV